MSGATSRDGSSSSMNGKVVVITGANRGIGKAFVESFLNHGASKIYAGVRDVDNAKINDIVFTKDVLESGVVVPIRIDLSDPQTIVEASKQIVSSNKDDGRDSDTCGGVIDIVINNAGALTRTRTLDADCVERLKYEMDVNVYGMIRFVQHFAPLIRNTTEYGNDGIFVQVNSVASIRCGTPDVATYSASKAAAFSMTQALEVELKEKYDLSVVSIHPGPIRTDMIKEAKLTDYDSTPPPSVVSESLIDAIRKHVEDTNIPLPFMIFPDDKSKNLGKVYRSYAEIVHDQKRAYG